MKKIFVPQLEAIEVAPILKKHRCKLPNNVEQSRVARWHYGIYYGYGHQNSWFPLNSMGGIATKVFHGLTVAFPVSIEKKLAALLAEKKSLNMKRDSCI